MARDLADFLLDPLSDCEGALDALDRDALLRAYQDLLAGGSAAAVEAVATRVLAAAPGSHAALVLGGQARLVAGRAQEVLRELAPPRGEPETCLPLRALRARALESAGDLIEAFGAYLDLADALPAATLRATALAPRAREIVHRRFDEALRAGRVDDAEAALSSLTRWWPRTVETLEAERELAVARGDEARELAVLRSLLAAGGERRDLALRRGELELTVGDPRVGLALIEGMAAASPSDAALAEALRRAKFQWRLLNAPESVRRIARAPATTRGDLAVLLYWLVPKIRSARPASARIASDILDHPAQDEIVRVVNLGLMPVDETLHRFTPDASLRPQDAVSALLVLLGGDAGWPACAGGARRGREALCQAAIDCGLLASSDACRAGITPSGRDVLEMLRQALERMVGE